MELRLLILLLFSCKFVCAQQYLTDARSVAVSNSFVAAGQETGIPLNIALLLNQNKSFVEVTAINKYSIKELTTLSAAFAKKINSNNSLFFAIARNGTNMFAEQIVDAAISKRIAAKFSTGVRLKYHQWKTNDSKYSNYQTFIPELSFHVNALSTINLGVIVRNPVRSRIDANEKKKLPAEIIAGVSALVSNKLIFSISSKSVTEKPSSVQAGIEYKYVSQFVLRAGYQSLPVSQSFGCELSLPNYNVAISIQTQSQLGLSSAISLTFQL